jgi:Mg-chelatase subunit ChlI
VKHRFFPFTAIVEQGRLRRALLLNAVNPAVGGVLIRGPSGTGKSTAVRGLAELLPEIAVVAECQWSCDPTDPCASCLARGGFEVTRRPRRIVNLPLNATEDRVAGTVDIARALKEGERALEPGLLAEANRGILYVDEINLLDDHLTDILLDAAALGVNVVEREGVSVSHPARFLLVGTMNPEEGELRPQIADRIGLQVEVDPLENPDARAEVARRREAFTHHPQRFIAEWEPVQESLREDVARAERLLPDVRVPDVVYGVVAKLVVRAGVASHRADVTMIECAKALAALAGRTEVETEDVLGAGVLALGHRLPFDPFGPAPTLDRRDVRRLLDEILDVEVAPKKAPSQTG